MNLRKQSRRYDRLKSWLESRLFACLLSGSVRVGDKRYWRYSDLIELANKIACQYDELYSLND